MYINKNTCIIRRWYKKKKKKKKSDNIIGKDIKLIQILSVWLGTLEASQLHLVEAARSSSRERTHTYFSWWVFFFSLSFSLLSIHSYPFKFPKTLVIQFSFTRFFFCLHISFTCSLICFIRIKFKLYLRKYVDFDFFTLKESSKCIFFVASFCLLTKT